MVSLREWRVLCESLRGIEKFSGSGSLAIQYFYQEDRSATSERDGYGLLQSTCLVC